jgi:hypothetical protein
MQIKMRFLNTTSLLFEEVADSDLTPDQNQYAILSHRWGRDEDEVTYEDIASARDVSHKRGSVKISEFCSLPSHSGYRYAWVDTCCINKGNSSELAEAINSMYMWYKQSALCVVYLEDVPRKSFEKSEWFDRGWTLQELIAPKAVSFFDHQWTHVGTKLELLDTLSERARIPKDVLSNDAEPSSYSVAQRMSWASQRVTKRLEDRAYSLLGLFGVNMPMIYGEREKAFLRLQQHIVRMSKDESIFAWVMEHDIDPSRKFSSIYASSPEAFRDSGNIVPITGSKGFEERNGDLCISMRHCRHAPGIFIAFLMCTDKARSDGEFSIYVSKIFDDETFARVRDWDGDTYNAGASALGHDRSFRFPVEPSIPPVSISYGFWLRTLELPGHGQSNATILSASPSTQADLIWQGSGHEGITGLVRFGPKQSATPLAWWNICWMYFYFDENLDPRIWLANDKWSPELEKPLEEDSETPELEKPSKDGHKALLRNCNAFHRKQDSRLRDQQNPCKLATTDVWYDWPEGRATVHVDRKKGLHDFDMPNLGLRISVRLQPWRTPDMVPSNSQSTPNTALIWVVDITPSEAPRPVLQHLILPPKWGWCMCSLLCSPFVVPWFVIGFGCLCCPNWFCCTFAGNDGEWHDFSCCIPFLQRYTADPQGEGYEACL